MQDLATLLRWLGPWTPPSAIPAGPTRTLLQIPRAEQRPLDAWLYQPTAPPRGVYLVLPGLHYLGPADPRCDRFCRVLAAANILVLCPFIPDYADHLVTLQALDDARLAFRALLDHPARPPHLRPGLWSVSFGSLLAFHVAADPRLGPHVGGLMTFGGYGDWHETLRFAAAGIDHDGTRRRHDPLNLPVIYMNVFPGLGHDAADREPLFRAWRRYMRATWGRPRYKRGEGNLDLARAHSLDLPTRLRDPFLEGCGAFPHSSQRALDGATACGPHAFDHCAPQPLLTHITAPAHIVHAADDDVIPLSQQRRILDALPPSTPAFGYTTGIFGHSDPNANALSPRRLRAAANEAHTLIQMLQGLLAAASPPPA